MTYSGSFSFGAWIYTKSGGLGTTTGRAFSKGAGADFEIQTSNTGQTRCVSNAAIAALPRTLNTWQFIFCVYNGTHMLPYLDGVLNQSAIAAVTVTGFNSSADVYVGNHYQLTRTFDGFVDEVRIYNYALSSEQIMAFYQNRTNTTVSQELADGDTWQCRVTPFSPGMAGSTYASNNVTLRAYSITLNASNLRDGGTYNSGDAAVLNITIMKNGAPYDPPNITVFATTAGGSPIENYAWPGSIVKAADGSYYIVTPVNLSLGAGIKWTVYISNNSVNLSSSTSATITVNPASGSLNMSMVDSANAQLPTALISLYDRNGYLVGTRSGAWFAEATLNDNYNISFNALGAALQLYGLNLTANSTVTPQYVQGPAAPPPQLMNYSGIIGMDASLLNISSANITLPLNGMTVDTICRCADWDVPSASCTGSWSCLPASEYPFASNATHFWFNVSGFSGFAGGTGYNANLTIWDSTEPMGNGTPALLDQQVTFYARYVNSTSGASINASNVSCQITFNVSGGWTALVNMTFNATSGLYNYNRSFASNGTYNWNATCNGSALGYNVLIANDTVLITNTTISNLVLNATSPFNVTTDNLTCNYTLNSPSITAAVAWYRNNTPAMMYYLPFEGTPSNALLDYSGWGHNVANAGAAVWNSTGGYDGKGAFMLDGTANSYLLDTNGGNYINGIGAFTVTLWVKSRVTNTDKGFIIAKVPNGNDDVLTVRYDAAGASGGCTQCMKSGITTASGVHQIESSSNVQTTSWQFLALRWTSGQRLDLFINGALDTPSWSNAPVGGTITTATRFVVGKGGKDTAGSWNGSVDDVRFYNYSLSADQIMALYLNRTGVMVGNDTRANETWRCAVTPFSSFDAGPTYQSNNITLNAIAVLFVPPTGSSGSFANRDYLMANASASAPAGVKNITIFLYNSSGAQINSSTTTSASFLFANFTGLPFGLYYINATAYDNGNSVAYTETRNITLTFPPSIVNLTLNATSAYNLTTDNLTCNYALNGTATTAAVAWYRNNATAMLLYMPFEGNASNALLDYSGNNMVFSTAGAPLWNSTRGYNNSGAFQNTTTTDLIYATNTSHLNGLTAFSYGMWIRPRTYTGTRYLLELQGAFLMYTANTNQIACSFNGSTIYTGNVMSTNNWNFVMCTYDGYNLSIYRNGAFITNVSNTGGVTNVTGNLSVVNRYARDRLFNGDIDDVRIYNSSLTAEQINALYLNRSDLVVSNQLSDADVWQCRVTPFSTVQAGQTYPSNNLTILAPGAPMVQFGYLTDNSSATPLNRTFIMANATASSIFGIANITIYLYNASSGALLRTAFSASSQLFYNFTGLPHGNYSINATAYSPTGTSNSTETRNITLEWPLALNVTLVPTSASNTSAGNYTCNYTLGGSAQSGTASWFQNGTPMMFLNMPFEGGSTSGNASQNGTTQDYSGRGHAGTVVSAPWNGSGGYDGNSSYYLNGSGYIRTNSNELKYADNFTISLWIKANDTIGLQHILWEGNATENGWGNTGIPLSHEMHLSIGRPQAGLGPINDTLTFFYGYEEVLGYWDSTVEINTSFNSTGWTHVAVVMRNASTQPRADLYVNCALAGNDSGNLTNRTGWDTNLTIGRPGQDTRYFRGYVDDVVIYNRSLTPGQIGTFCQNRTNVLTGAETNAGDILQCRVTPFSRAEAGIEAASQNQTVLASVINITFVSPTDNSSLVRNQSYAQVNVTAASTAGIANIAIFLYNSSGALINSTNGTASPLFINFTAAMPAGIYYFNATAYDDARNSSSTATWNVTIAIIPVDQLNKTPADITTTNAIGIKVNITYNITATVGVNASTVALYYKANTTSSDISYYVNGTAAAGFRPADNVSNFSSVWQFLLDDNDIYPATYNFDEEAMEFTPHSATTLSQSSDYVKIRLFNVSSLKNYSFFEVMAYNASPASGIMRVYYCNSSYISGNPTTTASCTNFYTINTSVTYNHSHSAYSSHLVMPFSMNVTSGQIGTTLVSPTSYFLLRGDNGGWNVSYITNVSRPDTIQLGTNNGNQWTNFSGTVDAHLHQYDGSDTLYWYACANDTAGFRNCSSVGYDFLNQSGLPPTAPHVYSPENTTYDPGFIWVNYTSALSPNGYDISHYNISLLYPNGTFVQTIQGNNSLNLSFYWNASNYTNGSYVVRVTACDVLGQCSYGLSEMFSMEAQVNCRVITSPGYYQMTRNYVGAPNSASPLTGNVCVKIASSDVTFNCRGYSITHNASATNTYGIEINSSFTNVTVINCPNISSYMVGITANGSRDITIANNTAYNCSGGASSSGIRLYSAVINATVENNTVILTGATGIRSDGTTPANNRYANNTVTSCATHGFRLQSEANGTYLNNIAYGNLNFGFYIITVTNGTFAGNLAYNNTQSGMYLQGAFLNNFTNNSLYSNGHSGLNITTASYNNTFSGMRVYNNTLYGFFFTGASASNAVLTTNVTDNRLCGVRVLNSNGNTFSGVLARNNSMNGITVNNSNNTIIDSCTVRNNTAAGIEAAGSNNTLVNRSLAYSNPYGILLTGATWTNVSTSNITNNTNAGIRMDSASSSASLRSNYVCSNSVLDINNQGSSNAGALDRCDAFASWSEAGHLGCEYGCTSMWQRYFGNVNGTIVLGNGTAAQYVYVWNSSGLNVYFVDYDSAIEWSRLQAMGRNTTNATSSSDFLELDLAFNTSAFSDNITVTYSADGTAPRETDNFTVFLRPVNYVPVANSTRYNTTFRSGIMWDMSDGGAEYSNAQNQSTVWVVKINASSTDAYGTYDFLGQVPYTLGRYEGGNDVISIYVEMK